MKQLTQAVFEGAPDWVKSAAVDEDGRLFFHECEKWFLEYEEDAGYWFSRSENLDGYMLISKNYDATDWQNSAIDREFAE